MRILSELPHRGVDEYGSGEFGASRSAGRRTHKGIDYWCPPGARIFSPVDGFVTKLGYPYADTQFYRYVEITTDTNLRHRLFYVEPSVKVGERVNKEITVVGEAQNIAARYGDGMKPHIHYEVLLQNGTPVNPEGGYVV